MIYYTYLHASICKGGTRLRVKLSTHYSHNKLSTQFYMKIFHRKFSNCSTPSIFSVLHVIVFLLFCSPTYCTVLRSSTSAQPKLANLIRALSNSRFKTFALAASTTVRSVKPVDRTQQDKNYIRLLCRLMRTAFG